MASSSKSGRKRVRSTVEVHFTSGSEKDAFQRRLEHIRQRLMPTGSSTALDNRSLLEASLGYPDLFRGKGRSGH